MDKAVELGGDSFNVDMTARLRAFDWATTELGAAATWSQSLRTIVDLVVAAPSPMLVWWGRDAIQIHNDAAHRELLAEAHSPALGVPAAQVWARAWDALGPAVANVRAGRGAVVLEQVALEDERTWRFALSPVVDDGGGIGGVLVIPCETTVSTSFREPHREHLRSLFMHAPSPIAIVRGPRSTIELANEAMAAAFDLNLSDVLGRPAFDVVPDVRPLFEPLFDSVRTTGAPRILKELQYRIEGTPCGSKLGRYANIMLAPLRDLRGTVEGVLVIAVEITDEVRARNEMQRLRTEAEAANRAKDEFLAILGHELRNPLTPISTALELMRMRGMAGREIDVVERQVGHLTRLVDDLLDVSRVMGGKLELHRKDIEVSELVAEALEVSSPLLERRRQQVDVDVSRGGLGVLADRERMCQAISNLLTNAAKYSDLESRISIRGGRTDDTVWLAIRDHGVGIAPEMLGRIFEPFVQQPQTIDRASGGLGLGLSIVRSLVELHGGRVCATSEGVGRGSEFTIELPASVRHPAPSPGPRSEIASERIAGARPKVLVVDDNEDAASMLRDALEAFGYEVAVAHDGPTALRIAPVFAPEVALLDLGLPVMDGFELAEQLREQLPTSCPHLVAVTGYGQPADKQRSRQAGFERHLVKPISLEMVSRVVAELVASNRVPPERASRAPSAS